MVWKAQPHWLIDDWLGLMEPARGESFPSGQRLGPAASGEDSVLSPDQKSFYISTTNTNNLGTKTEIARFDTAPRGVETPPQWLVADWLGLMEPARGESCSSGQR